MELSETIEMIDKLAAAIQQNQKPQDSPHSCENRLQCHLSNRFPLAGLQKLKLAIYDDRPIHNFSWLRSVSILPHLQELEFDNRGQFEYVNLPSDLKLPTIKKFCYHDGWIPGMHESDFDNRDLPCQFICCMKQLRSFTVNILSPDNDWNEFLQVLRGQRGDSLEELRLQCPFHEYGLRLDTDVFQGYRALKIIEVSLTCFVRSTCSGLFRTKRLVDYLPSSLEKLIFWISAEGDWKFQVDEGPGPRHVNVLDATRDVFAAFQLLRASHIPYLNGIQIKYHPQMSQCVDISGTLNFVKALCRKMDIDFEVVEAQFQD